MDSSGDAALRLHFSIGPSSALGRALALRLLLCRSAAHISRLLLSRLRRLVRLVLLPFDPARPHALLALVVAAAIALRRARAVRSRANFWRRMMSAALGYEDWAEAARMLEKEEQGRRRRRLDSDLYDEDLVRTKLGELRMRRKEGVVQDIVFCLRTDLVRNLGNMCNPELHAGRLHVPDLIQDYIDEVRYHLRAVCDSDQDDDLPLEEKLAFVRETRHAFGRTALLLSGGASLGAFHVGVVRTLIEHHLLPRVVAGASVGSIICSVIATRTWSDLQSFFGDDMPTLQFFDQLGGIFGTLNRLFTKGAVHDIRRLQQMLRELTQNMTFQEAYDLTGRVLGISVCSPRKHEPPRCLNYLTSPHVVIWSAVTASCAFPGLFEAQELMAKDRLGQLVPYHTPVQASSRNELGPLGARHWRDGSLESDLPMVQLKELFNVNHFVVSQANPHIAPLLRLKDMVRNFGGDFAARLARLSEMEVKHRCNQIWELGFPMGGIAKLFAQDWEGDVTIVMPATLAQFAKMIQNPNAAELQKAVNQGRRCTWEKLSAINANCGIELMLDECVSELNRRRRIKRLETNSHQVSGSMTRSSFGAKRIPSWNCIARENSWGSLDEEGIVESTPSSGGPWAGPSMGTLKPHRMCCDGSDSESDSMDANHYSWTRAGGPLMRTASASQFIQEHGGEQNLQINREDWRSCDSTEEVETCRVLTPRESSSTRRANNTISGNNVDHVNRKLCVKRLEDSDVEENEYCENAVWIGQSLLQPKNGSAVAEVCLRAFIDEQSVTSENDEEAPCKLRRSIVYGSFGSFIRKTTDESAVNTEISA